MFSVRPTRRATLIALALTASLTLISGAWAISPPLASPALASVEFSVGSTGSGVGLPPSAVFAELVGEGGAPPGALETYDDIYAQFYVPAGAFPFTNIKEYDDGGPLVGSPSLLPEPPASLTIRTAGPDGSDVDSFAIISTLPVVTPAPASTALTATGPKFVQFSVDAGTVGAPGPPPDVASEAALAEALGDIFEGWGPPGPTVPVLPGSGLTAFPGGNSLISDEGAHGLSAAPASPDDLDALIVDDWSLALPPTINTDDTDTLGTPDMPLVFFTFNPAAATPVGFASGADLYTPGVGVAGPAPDPVVDCPAANLGLLAGDNIDALFIDATATHVIFSLDPFSVSAPGIFNPFAGGPGVLPGDLIHVTLGAPLPHLGVPIPPATPPAACLLGFDIGLAPGDNLNALWISEVFKTATLVPVELSVFSAD